LNKNNVLDNGIYKNQLLYKFNSNFNIPKNSHIKIEKAQIPYSMFNISNYYYNNTLIIEYPNGNIYNTYNLTIPNGYYDITTFNNYIKFFLESNNLYLVDNNNIKQYYINFSYNLTYYSIQLDIKPLPNILPSGWANPGPALPSIQKTPRILFNSKINEFLGFNINEYYPSNIMSVSYQKLSPNVPISTYINSIVIRSNIIDNKISYPSDILTILPIFNVEYGGNLNYQSQSDNFISIKEGSYDSILISLYDDSANNLINNIDKNIILLLTIKIDD
jgi:hypothetical protein